MQRNGQKRDKTKPMGENDRKQVFFPQLLSQKVFGMDFSQKLFMVFLNSLVEGIIRTKRHKKNHTKKRESTYPGTYLI
jgi:hypothetical protein